MSTTRKSREQPATGPCKGCDIPNASPAGTALSAPALRASAPIASRCWRCKGSGDMEVTAGRGPGAYVETTICSQCGGTGVEDD